MIVESKAKAYSFKSIVERKAKDLWTFLLTRKLSVSRAFIFAQQTNSENKKNNSQKRLWDCYLWFPTYIHEVLIVWRTYLY